MPDFNIVKSNLAYFLIYQSCDDDGRRNVSWHVFNMSRVAKSSVRLNARHARVHIANADFIHPGRFFTPPLADPQENHVTGIIHLQTVNYDIFNKSTIDCFQCNGRTIGIIDGILNNLDIFKTTKRSCAEFYAVRACPDPVVINADIAAEEFRVVRLQANAVVCRIYEGIGYGDAVTIDNIYTVLITEIFVFNRYLIDSKVLTLVVSLVPACRIAQNNFFNSNITAATHINVHRPRFCLWSSITKRIFNEPLLNSSDKIPGHLLALSIYHAFTCNSNILLLNRKDQRSPGVRFIINWLQPTK
jgi:hypothetical protein